MSTAPGAAAAVADVASQPACRIFAAVFPYRHIAITPARIRFKQCIIFTCAPGRRFAVVSVRDGAHPADHSHRLPFRHITGIPYFVEMLLMLFPWRNVASPRLLFPACRRDKLWPQGLPFLRLRPYLWPLPFRQPRLDVQRTLGLSACYCKTILVFMHAGCAASEYNL